MDWRSDPSTLARRPAPMGPWYRVFGSNDAQPAPAAILECLQGPGHPVRGDFTGDEAGWYAAAIHCGDTVLELERFLVTEEGIRGELNNWAAWLETCEHSPQHVPLMERVIQSRQLFTLRGPDERLCVALCRFLAEATEGVWQADDAGFFATDGTLLVPEKRGNP
jgi:hypothetical protein